MKTNKTNKDFLLTEPITIPAKEIRSCLGDMIDKARYAHQPYLITKQNKPAVMMIGVDDYENMLKMLETKDGKQNQEK